jgi:predicted aspartyl protease
MSHSLLAALVPTALLAAVSVSAQPSSTQVLVPFVGCPSEGQAGPLDPPKGSPRPVSLPAAIAKEIAWYVGEQSEGIFAPRGWHCQVLYGSSGSTLVVTPATVDTSHLYRQEVRGPAVELESVEGSGSGRFQVAAFSSLVFPKAAAALIERVKEESPDLLQSEQEALPHARDSISTVADDLARFVTPANAKGLGTACSLRPTDDAIHGIAIFDEGGLSILRVRLGRDLKHIEAAILRLNQDGLRLPVPLARTGPDPGPSRILAKPLAEVPFTLHQNGVILEAQINGRDSIRLLLDTGWGPLALVSTTAQRLGLPYKSSSGELPRVKAKSLAVGGAVKRDVTFEVFPAEELVPLIGPHDGVLSTDFFKDLVLQIDYVAGVVRFYSSSPIPRQDPGESGARAMVPMILSPRAGALPFTDAVLLDGKPVRALFDTGGAGGFMAMQQLVDRAGLEVLPDTGPKVTIGLLGNGQATQQIVQFARVGRIALGSFVVESPRVMIAPTQIEGADWGHDLNIGYGFMRSYVVTFDYPNKLIAFERPGSLPAQGAGSTR